MGLVYAAARVTTLNYGNYAFKLGFNRVSRTHFIILHFLSPTVTADGVNSAEYDEEEGWRCAAAFLLDVGLSLIIIYRHDVY